MFSSARARVVLIILILCFSASAWLGIYTNPHGQTRFVKYFAALVGNATATVGGRPIPSFGNATKPTDLAAAEPLIPSTCGWKAPYACGCADDDNDIATMRRILWNQTALELLNAGLSQPKYEKHSNYTFLQVHEAGFEELRRRFAVFFENQTAFNISCEHVVIKVSIFPKTPLSQRDTRDVEFKIADTYIGPKKAAESTS